MIHTRYKMKSQNFIIFENPWFFGNSILYHFWFFFVFLCTRQFFNSKKGDLDYFPRTNLFKANASIEIKLGGNVHRIIIYSLYIFFVGNPSQKKKRPNEIKHGVSIYIGRKSITEKKRGPMRSKMECPYIWV